MRLRNLGFALALTLTWSTSGCSTETEEAAEEGTEEHAEEGEADEAEEAEEGEEAVEDADEVCCDIGGKFKDITRGECTEKEGTIADADKCVAAAPAPKAAPKRRKVEKPKK